MSMDVNCPEIKAKLKPGLTPYNRPDILCRVLEIKINKFMAMILGIGGESPISGKTTAHIVMIEFQKRGEIEMSSK